MSPILGLERLEPSGSGRAAAATNGHGGAQTRDASESTDELQIVGASIAEHNTDVGKLQFTPTSIGERDRDAPLRHVSESVDELQIMPNAVATNKADLRAGRKASEKATQPERSPVPEPTATNGLQTPASRTFKQVAGQASQANHSSGNTGKADARPRAGLRKNSPHVSSGGRPTRSQLVSEVADDPIETSDEGKVHGDRVNASAEPQGLARLLRQRKRTSQQEDGTSPTRPPEQAKTPTARTGGAHRFKTSTAKAPRTKKRPTSSEPPNAVHGRNQKRKGSDGSSSGTATSNSHRPTPDVVEVEDEPESSPEKERTQPEGASGTRAPATRVLQKQDRAESEAKRSETGVARTSVQAVEDEQRRRREEEEKDWEALEAVKRELARKAQISDKEWERARTLPGAARRAATMTSSSQVLPKEKQVRISTTPPTTKNGGRRQSKVANGGEAAPTPAAAAGIEQSQASAPTSAPPSVIRPTASLIEDILPGVKEYARLSSVDQERPARGNTKPSGAMSKSQKADGPSGKQTDPEILTVPGAVQTKKIDKPTPASVAVHETPVYPPGMGPEDVARVQEQMASAPKADKPTKAASRTRANAPAAKRGAKVKKPEQSRQSTTRKGPVKGAARQSPTLLRSPLSELKVVESETSSSSSDETESTASRRPSDGDGNRAVPSPSERAAIPAIEVQNGSASQETETMDEVVESQESGGQHKKKTERPQERVEQRAASPIEQPRQSREISTRSTISRSPARFLSRTPSPGPVAHEDANAHPHPTLPGSEDVGTEHYDARIEKPAEAVGSVASDQNQDSSSSSSLSDSTEDGLSTTDDGESSDGDDGSDDSDDSDDSGNSSDESGSASAKERKLEGIVPKEAPSPAPASAPAPAIQIKPQNPTPAQEKRASAPLAKHPAARITNVMNSSLGSPLSSQLQETLQQQSRAQAMTRRRPLNKPDARQQIDDMFSNASSSSSSSSSSDDGSDDEGVVGASLAPSLPPKAAPAQAFNSIRPSKRSPTRPSSSKTSGAGAKTQSSQDQQPPSSIPSKTHVPTSSLTSPSPSRRGNYNAKTGRGYGQSQGQSKAAKSFTSFIPWIRSSQGPT